MNARDASDEGPIWLVNLPSTPRQRWSALGVTAALFLGFAILAPFAARPLPRIDAFIPALEAMVVVTDLITAVLLFALFSIYRSRPLLVLANGYLFNALIVIPHALTFPGAFSPTGLLGAGLQSTAWLWVFWHFGFAVTLLSYAVMKTKNRAGDAVQASPLASIGWSIVLVVSLVCGLTVLAIAGDDRLPRLFLDTTRPSRLGHYEAITMIVICSMAPIVLWRYRHSVLDQWLIVTSCAMVLEMVFTALFTNPRFSVGFYAGRSFSLVTSTIVLAVLLGETTRLYARLARANMMLQRERHNKLMNLEAMLASVSHEVKQPLGAIVLTGGAGLRFLGHPQPDLDGARSALRSMVDNGQRASEVLDNLRTLFGRTTQAKEPVDMNVVAQEALHHLRSDLRAHGVTTRAELTSELPLVMGHRGQLREVILNLVHNAIEAMDAVTDGRRVLHLRTQQEEDSVILAVEDSGPGIDPTQTETMFDAFVTTKLNGMGLGLAISRMIVEHHGGQISASPAHSRGVVLRVVLPAGTLPLEAVHD